MRTMIAAIVFVVSVLLIAPVKAAPTCEDAGGNVVRCGTQNAMPVGWHAPAADRHIVPGDKENAWDAVIFLVLLFSLIALLPDFDQKEWDGRDQKKKTDE